MPTSVGPKDLSIVLSFGAGVHSRPSEADIDPSECALGINFDLDPDNREFKNRKPFDLLGTATNAASINGFVNLQKSDGTITMLVQAGNTVYKWDGTSFTSKGTVNAASKLRGPLSQNWQLGDKVIITDIALQDVVMEWDGTTLSDVSFLSDPSTAHTGTFKARYCTISNERAMFANVEDNGTDFPHLIVGSQRGDYQTISVANRPSSSLSEADAFFLIQPDYKYINGLVHAFGQTVTSSRDGSMFHLTGDSAKDFGFSELYPGSGASGDEAVTYVGNDVAYGRAGRIESLMSTDTYGDVEVDDISLGIFDLIENFNNWTIVYNSRKQRVYCFSAGTSQLWVLHKSLLSSGKSPWSKWTTDHSMGFGITAMMSMLDPVDGLEYVYFGDANGNLYRMEGSGSSGDGGTNLITSERLSSLIMAPIDSQAYGLEGWIKYRAGSSGTVTLRFEYAGTNIFNEEIQIDIPSTTSGYYYGGSAYYNSGIGYGSLSGRLTRQTFGVPGKGNEFQVKATVEGASDFTISEIGLRFETTT